MNWFAVFSDEGELIDILDGDSSCNQYNTERCGGCDDCLLMQASHSDICMVPICICPVQQTNALLGEWHEEDDERELKAEVGESTMEEKTPGMDDWLPGSAGDEDPPPPKAPEKRARRRPATEERSPWAERARSEVARERECKREEERRLVVRRKFVLENGIVLADSMLRGCLSNEEVLDGMFKRKADIANLAYGIASKLFDKSYPAHGSADFEPPIATFDEEKDEDET